MVTALRSLLAREFVVVVVDDVTAEDEAKRWGNARDTYCNRKSMPALLKGILLDLSRNLLQFYLQVWQAFWAFSISSATTLISMIQMGLSKSCDSFLMNAMVLMH